MQTDPVGYSAGINWYLYCGNNPLGFVDPSGLDPVKVDIPLHTVWHQPSSDEYLEQHPEHSHKKDVDAYLIDVGFYDLYTDITLESADYSNGYYHCVFDVDDPDIKMNMVEINGVSVLNVTDSEGTNTPIIDQRLANMMGYDTTGVAGTYTASIGWWPPYPVASVGGGLTAAGGGLILGLVKYGAVTSWTPVGKAMVIAGGVVIVVDAAIYILSPRENVPNLAEIEDAFKRLREREEKEIDEYP